MKKKLLFLAMLFALFGLGIVIRYVFLSRSAAEGRLQIISSPSASILVNGKPSGKTPYEASFAGGEYILKLITDDTDASSSGTWEGKISVYKNARTFVSREIGTNDLTSSGVILTVLPLTKENRTENTKPDSGQIEVQTYPDGSIVFLDDEEQGIAPLILSNISKGDHELSVFSPGFFRRSQKIKVSSGFKVVAEYKLAIDPSHKKVEKKPDDIATDEASVQKKETEQKLVVSINQTDTGWLRVRAEPTLFASEAAKVKPGQTFNVLEEQSGWYKIEYENGKQGWIFAQYTSKQNESKPTLQPSP
ncbi:hypothetical protein A3B02_01260 [Candidatus Roizmanbacteria bacterium RIFCSPLOWO2_01_FULL_42_14]|uniref:SH3b domain-containing protein n=4 Tax=Candidatus Roizmaniibacteriota TaxID=1752723 RepID=A0A1F7JUX7_9BACT|nr:MAG: hypothetical protein A3D08_02350 [Candidatus Roizmanbacteria bacterium RIFCSPHIGHO2_02_FULL_43_11]OGK38393.1 MAG: hypothetical protein A3F32_00240 [Candidatus Roizmanbacteria bacterium RIFCSPHIGHO2_12_FULL_42_10]OGK52183.1 MAG: hypothetical protein A3B02_01260 [Candidatus Roizmanbacteria bacterium RIFCSPLOWO2_01_FULL_42_14]OGK59416.1 MAG: hypothetical protein A3I56_01945 [Candidatus Roizmanbacteria bacterium RIFCSPLOWO2_02_FULL_43_10]